MYTNVSSTFISLLSSGMNIAAKCEVWSEPTASAPSALLGQVPIEDCTAVMARGSDQQGSCSITISTVNGLVIPGTSLPLIPAGPTDWLDPLSGNELRPYFGVKHPNGTIEYVPMGVYPIGTTEIDDTGEAVTITVSGYDRAWEISQRPMPADYAVPSGVGIAAAVADIISQVYPGLPMNITPGAWTVPAGASLDQGDDAWEDGVLMIGEAAGYTFRFDRWGTLLGYPIPNPATQTAWTTPALNETSSSLMTALTKSRTQDGVFNSVTVAAQGSANATTSSPPVQATESDTNPASPTYTGGPLGTRPEFITSTLAQDSTDCTNAAENELMSQLASVEQLTITTKPCPLWDPDDVVYVSRARLRVAGNYVIDTATMSNRHDGSSTLAARYAL